MAKRDIQEVNAGSMADIAFLLLIFFLMTTTMDTDTGLTRMLPPPVLDDQEPPPPIRERNVFEVLINAQNQLLVERQPMALSQLRDAAKEFIENPLNLDHLPAKEMVDVPFFGTVPVTTNAVISLQNDRGTQYQMYLAVQNELQAAYTELRDEISRRQFNRPYRDLTSDEQSAVRQIYPQRISEAEPRNFGGRN
ncbi:ExbD/TolR family protein [Alkalitalea saponilacus]|uniref:Biopolymer transport protein ExbD n=1 Tax=Alkalitalea saponilacus TaxID=889453 RepID=A0A1T5BX59_9BACT|nr:biopolymer transporter ExbD [Alkalitalea saponilacus]ASB49554.1 biopolymer transporter ExbD [Alkalitalea saponilacus]SKB51948.1 Biopolymer transport protein ExbD [Alkalitalea saponilacus]